MNLSDGSGTSYTTRRQGRHSRSLGSKLSEVQALPLAGTCRATGRSHYWGTAYGRGKSPRPGPPKPAYKDSCNGPNRFL